jgi:hypothetical protein
MICPHCGIGTSPNFEHRKSGGEPERDRFLVTSPGNCTECSNLIVMARWVEDASSGDPRTSPDFQIYPPGPSIRPIDPAITGEYEQDFREALLVLNLSPKASAAVSRRLLQHVIRQKGGIKKATLNDEIVEIIKHGNLSADLADDLDMIRTIGNFGAHPIKSTNSGEVVDVEPGEAEALIDVLEELLDFYFVRPARRQAQRDAINAKLKEAGKPQLKGT